MKPIKTILLALLALVVLSPTALAQKRVAYLTLEDPVVERDTSAGIFASSFGTTLRDVIATFRAIAENDDLDGLVIRIKTFPFSRTQIEEIAPGMEQIRASGKRIHIFTENYSTPDFLLGAHADELIIQAGGSVSLTGLYMEELFLADMLRKFGIEPSFVQIGDYKGAEELFANSEPSDAWNQNIDQLLDALYATMLDQIASGRHTSRSGVENAMKQLIFADPERAISAGMIDAAIDRLDLDKHLAKHYGRDFEYVEEDWTSPDDEAPDFAQMGLFEAFGTIMRMLSEPPVPDLTHDTIAVVHIDGPIVDGESSRGGLFGGSTVGAITIRETLRELQNEPLVRAVVVRINSPGGSATASENIWLGIDALKNSGKPVWVSVGSMAASGGYYIAVSAERIYMNPSSIVGSIGVVAGKLAIDGLFEKLEINAVPRTRGPNVGMLGALHPWDNQERELIRDRMMETYDLFTHRVTQGRKGIDLDKAAEGRLFTAERAIELRMADSVGGIERTVTDLAEAIGLVHGQFDIRDYPRPPSFEEMIEEMFGSAHAGTIGAELSRAAIHDIARQALGDRAWSDLQAHLEALMQLREDPVVLAMPRVIIFR